MRIAVIPVLSLLCISVTACDDKKPAPVAETAATPPPPAPTPQKSAEPPPEAKRSRPEKLETEVTPERRTKAEAAVPEAKGFLVGQTLEEKLKAMKTLKEKEAGVTAFDKLAKGKWVLFTGPISNPTDSGFDLGITYTPQIKGDMMGMSRQWFPVTFTDVKGYEASKFKPGQVVVVLAKYEGKEKASPGNELVETGNW
ncbi:MAG TPA: hypothetical protein VH062_33590 [Polyangiaceae bacterium]|jgi:hypothetical protein|nr:hypothetical protein [Polyangiaceae bacterium]